jgi:hypothetical protein
MKYFNTLPLVLQNDFNGNALLVNNLITRAYLLPSLTKNVMLYYKYDLKDSDTPENIAYKYYEDIDRYWIVLYSNGITDPQGDWPLTNQQFDLYLVKKYAEDAGSSEPSVILSYTTGTIHHYEQTIVTTDSGNLQKQSITIEIDENTYNTTTDTEYNSVFPNGVKVSKKITKNAVSIYEYENRLNESKRKINIMKKDFVGQMETQLKSVMKA